MRSVLGEATSDSDGWFFVVSPRFSRCWEAYKTLVSSERCSQTAGVDFDPRRGSELLFQKAPKKLTETACDAPRAPSSVPQRRRVAVYGGTFDPPTNSHMTCASESFGLCKMGG